MPIKFRCQHCQQLLGISRARAGALVDCPQCGRSLRVPSLDGKIGPVPDAKEAVRQDGDLLSALSQLSALSTQVSKPVASPKSDNDANIAGSPDNSAQSTPAPLRESDVEELPVPAGGRVIPSSDETGKLGDPLQELADSFGSTDVEDFGFEPVSHTVASGVGWLGVVMAILAGTAAGWWLGQVSSGTTVATSDTAAAPNDATGAGPNGQGVGAAPHRQPATSGGTVHGTVLHEDASGQRLPDSAALVILLPQNRTGTVLLSGRSLRREAEDPDFRATVAALDVLGVKIATAGDDGRYVLNATAAGSYVLVVFSRHVERPADSAVQPEVGDVLSQYFDSINSLAGRLAAKTVDVEVAGAASVAVDVIVFGRNP